MPQKPRSPNKTIEAGVPARRPGRPRRAWVKLPDDQFLGVRFCDLDLRIQGTVLEDRVQRLYAELERRGLGFRPHVWLSTEWFTPDGVPGIAIPFYLAHPRLVRLERGQMLGAEGASEESCMRILRHEAGHAIDNAYRLHFKRRWQQAFGKFSTPYPEYYQPKPYSRRFVLHLDSWYAQAHPAEDFAETFAVWLTPGSRWRQRYEGWHALRKLQYVDDLMRETAGTSPKVRHRRVVEPLHKLRTTLLEHYREKRRHYGQEWPDFYDRDLRHLFSDRPRFAGNMTAAQFLREVRSELRETVSKWTETSPYTIDQVLIDMIDRCKELRLRLAVSPRKAKVDIMMLVTVQTMNYLHAGHHRVAL